MERECNCRLHPECVETMLLRMKVVRWLLDCRQAGAPGSQPIGINERGQVDLIGEVSEGPPAKIQKTTGTQTASATVTSGALATEIFAGPSKAAVPVSSYATVAGSAGATEKLTSTAVADMDAIRMTNLNITKMASVTMLGAPLVSSTTATAVSAQAKAPVPERKILVNPNWESALGDLSALSVISSSSS